ncbi:MAG: lipid droplet-associated protein [Actinomycetota bacterium]|nr:lipid droplet-associated protein [Actinomycetota bacterium]
MSTLPLPVRIAVGLAVTAVEQARKLPEQLSELPVTAASRAVQAAMRVQQRVTELAIKGDEVVALFQPVEDAPPWARFDEDDEPGGSSTKNTTGVPHTTGTTGAVNEFGRASDGAARTAVAPGSGTGHGTTATGHGEVDEGDVARAMTPVPPPATDAQPRDAASADADVARSGIRPPPALPGYDELSLAQLRAKLRTLSLPQLTELLEYEHVHQDRAAFVTMLSNRISTVRAHMTESQ